MDSRVPNGLKGLSASLLFDGGGARRISHIKIPLSLHPLCGKSRDHLHGIVVEKFVVMPGEAMRMHEDVDVRKVVVIVDDIR